MTKLDYEKLKIDMLQWIKDYVESANSKGAVIGISGGKDSTVCGKLLVEALGKENVYGVLMPNGEQKDIDDSLRVVEFLDIPYEVVNINEAYNGVLNAIAEKDLNKQALTNIPPRLRMTVLYAIAANKNYLVAGTGNKSEHYIGYFTKWGDGACDFNPLENLNTEEVVALGDYLGMPYDLVHKSPADGLTGKTDEENLGIKYSDVNLIMANGTCGNKEADEKIKRMYNISRHKLRMPAVFQIKE